MVANSSEQVNKEYDLIFGVNSVREKLKTAPAEIFEILLAQGKLRPVLEALQSDAAARGIQLVYVSSRDLDQLVHSERHQGVIARVKAYSYHSVSDLEKLEPSALPNWILIPDGLTDPRNLGALLRSAEAVGIGHIVLPKDRSVGITPIVAKSSAGALSHVRIYRATNLRRAIRMLKSRGFWAIGLDANAAAAYDSIHYPQKLAIILGSEGKGMRPLIAKECDYVVRIPMNGKISSLNVSIAGAVLFYELLRQRSIDKANANR
jgi:23S rRNA (guanosine2251-2'-O)-methyltransferase